MRTPKERILAGATIGAIVGIVAVVVVSLLSSPGSNLIGLGAILIGAPLGAIAGAVIGDRENRAILILWALTLLLTVFFAIAPKMMAPPIAVQFLFVFAAFRFRSAQKWALAAIFILTAVLTLFPPVTNGFCWIFDSRLDASHHVPELTVRRSLLLLEFVIAGLIGAAIVRSAKTKAPAGLPAPHRDF